MNWINVFGIGLSGVGVFMTQFALRTNVIIDFLGGIFLIGLGIVFGTWKQEKE